MAMIPLHYKGFTIKRAKSTGGKAGRGYNKTTTIQVMKDGFLKKHFSFVINEPDAQNKAVEKARKYIGKTEAE